MTDQSFFSAFNDWWADNPTSNRSVAEREKAKKAFIAGCKFASIPREFKFQAGRWVVTVRASTLDAAKAEAIRKLDQRAAKLGAAPPEGGWRLLQIHPQP